MINKPLHDQNWLFHSIPTEEWNRLLPHIERVELPLGKVLSESGFKMDYLYFPTTAIVSMINELENGSAAEFATIGNRGCVGICIFMGGHSMLSRAVVSSAGFGFRIKAQYIVQEFEKGGPVMHLFLRYTQALITQLTQTAVCNRHHTVDQQLCRWLLLCLDKLPSHEMKMTQQLISTMLGVRREGITEAALQMQKAGLIKYSRGLITVIDRPGLEKRVCECYQVVKQEYERLLPEKPAN